MGAVSIGLSRRSSAVQLDGSSVQNGESHLVCFLSHCNGLPTNLPHHCATIFRVCEITRRPGIRVCRTITLTRPLLWHGILRLYSEIEALEITSVVRASGNADSIMEADPIRHTL